MSNTAVGYATIVSAVIIAVTIYTIIKLRKQAGKAKESELKKNKNNQK